MKFLMLHLNEDGRKVWLNPEHISIVRESNDEVTPTCVHVSNCSHVLKIRETTEEVARLCEEAGTIYELANNNPNPTGDPTMQDQNYTIVNGNVNKKSTPFWPMGTPEALAIAFTALKLHGSISWNWWWVTAPVWGVIAFKTIVGVVAIAAGVKKNEVQ